MMSSKEVLDPTSPDGFGFSKSTAPQFSVALGPLARFVSPELIPDFGSCCAP